MRKNPSRALTEEKILTIIMSLLAGIGTLTVVSFILASAALVFDLSEDAVRTMSLISLSAGCFAASACAGNRRRRHGIATGLICGLAVFTAVLFIGMLTVRSFSAGGIITKLTAICASSALGGITGVNTRIFAKYR